MTLSQSRVIVALGGFAWRATLVEFLELGWMEPIKPRPKFGPRCLGRAFGRPLAAGQLSPQSTKHVHWKADPKNAGRCIPQSEEVNQRSMARQLAADRPFIERAAESSKNKQ